MEPQDQSLVEIKSCYRLSKGIVYSLIYFSLSFLTLQLLFELLTLSELISLRTLDRNVLGFLGSVAGVILMLKTDANFRSSVSKNYLAIQSHNLRFTQTFLFFTSTHVIPIAEIESTLYRTYYTKYRYYGCFGVKKRNSIFYYYNFYAISPLEVHALGAEITRVSGVPYEGEQRVGTTPGFEDNKS